MKHLSRSLALVLMLSGFGAAAPAYAEFKAGFIHTDRVFREATPLKDPETGQILGYEAQYVGQVKLVRGENREDKSPTTSHRAL